MASHVDRFPGCAGPHELGKPTDNVGRELHVVVGGVDDVVDVVNPFLDATVGIAVFDVVDFM